MASNHSTYLSLRLLGADEFGGEQVRASEEDDVRNQDADVTPLVRVEVLVGRVDVCVAVNKVLSDHGADSGACALVACSVRVARYEGDARELAIMELVDHERFESVRDRIKVIEPSDPA